jgi:hypothetical protein
LLTVALTVAAPDTEVLTAVRLELTFATELLTFNTVVLMKTTDVLTLPKLELMPTTDRLTVPSALLTTPTLLFVDERPVDKPATEVELFAVDVDTLATVRLVAASELATLVTPELVKAIVMVRLLLIVESADETVVSEVLSPTWLVETPPNKVVTEPTEVETLVS